MCRVVFPQMLAHYISPDVHSTPCRWAGLMAPLDTKSNRGPEELRGPSQLKKPTLGLGPPNPDSGPGSFHHWDHSLALQASGGL